MRYWMMIADVNLAVTDATFLDLEIEIPAGNGIATNATVAGILVNSDAPVGAQNESCLRWIFGDWETHRPY